MMCCHVCCPTPARVVIHRESCLFCAAVRDRYLFHTGALSFSVNPVTCTLAIAYAIFHMLALTSSRLVLGVHSVGDVTGGIVRVLQLCE